MEERFYHKFDGVDEALVELGVLEVVLWVVGAVHHPTGAAGYCSKLLLTRVLKRKQKNTRQNKRETKNPTSDVLISIFPLVPTNFLHLL